MSGSINQMQMLYVPEEDRILFRVNSTDKQEYRLWLTRRYALLLNKVFEAHLGSDPDVSTQETPEAKQAIQEFKQEKAMEGANYKQAFDEKPNELPQGNQVPLGFKINYKIQGENMQLTLDPKEGPGLNIVINRQITANLAQLLKNASNQGEWSLQSSTQTTPQTRTHVVN